MIELEAGAIVVRADQRGPCVLLVTAKENSTHWLFPKGHIEPGETATDAAQREVMEEAGIEAVVTSRVGESRYELDGRSISVEYFLLAFVAEREAKEGRKTEWLSLDDADRRLTFDTTRDMLRQARPFLPPPSA